MRLTLVLTAALILACGEVNDRQACRVSADCGPQQYCSQTADGSVCWPDEAPPEVKSVSVACGGAPCARDGVVTVRATVTDDHGLGPVVATLDLDGHAHAVAMTKGQGDTYEAQLPLVEWAFPHAEKAVAARVTATDGAQNVASADGATSVNVTRLRWSKRLEATGAVVPTAPAVKPDGTVVVGATTGSLYFVNHAGSVTRSAVTLSDVITQPPTIGASAIWVAANTRVYAVALDGSQFLNGSGCDTGGSVVGPPAIGQNLTPETAFAASAGTKLWTARASATTPCGPSSVPRAQFVVGPVLVGEHVFAVSGVTPSTSTMHIFWFSEGYDEINALVLGQVIDVSPSIDADGRVWTGATGLIAVDIGGGASDPLNLDSAVRGSTAIFPDGDLAVAVGTSLQRFSSTGTRRWSNPVDLGASGRTPIVLAEGRGVRIVIPSTAGSVVAISENGEVVWRATLAPGQELREGNIHSPSNSTVSTAYFTSSDGYLHALIVDGHLDTDAPWPKAWHDPRNTSNADAPF